MNNQISPTVKHVWNVAVHVQHNFWGFVFNITAYHLGQCERSSPSTKELQGLGNGSNNIPVALPKARFQIRSKLTFGFLSFECPLRVGLTGWSVVVVSDVFFASYLIVTFSPVPARWGGHGPLGEFLPELFVGRLLRLPSAWDRSHSGGTGRP